MDTIKRLRKILALGAVAVTLFLTAPAVSNAAVPGPGDLTVDPCTTVTHGCEPTHPGDSGPGDLTSNPEGPGDPGPGERDPLDGVPVVQPRYNG